MRLTEFSYKKKDGTIERYSVLAFPDSKVDESDDPPVKDIQGIKLNDLPVDDVSKLKNAFVVIQDFVGKYFKGNYRVFQGNNIQKEYPTD